MQVFNIFRSWETKYALTFVGLVVGLLFGAFTVYVAFQKTTPGLRIEEISRANVIDVKEDIGKLEILFNGVNLRDKHQSLALVTLKLSNDGGAPIAKSAYDDADPVGVKVSGGDFTKADLYAPSTPNIGKSMRVAYFTNSMATLAPVILEAGDSFWMKLLVLHDEKTTFDIRPIGKIAGVREIIFAALNTKQAPTSVWMRAISGNWMDQLLRVIIYLFAPIFALVLFVSVTISAQAAKRRAHAIASGNERKENVLRFRAKRMADHQVFDTRYNWVFDYYIESGRIVVRQLMDVIAKPDLVEALPQEWKRELGNSHAFVASGNMVAVAPEFAELIRAFNIFLSEV